MAIRGWAKAAWRSRNSATARERHLADGAGGALNRAPLNAFVYFLRPYFGQRRERDARAFDATFDELVALADEQTRADLNTYRSFLAGLVGVVLPGSPFESANERLRIDNEIAAIKSIRAR